MKIINKIENIIWIFIISMGVYLLIPLLLRLAFKDYGTIISIICVLFINVIYSFIASIILTKKYGFTYIYPISIAVTYLICAPLIYNYETLVYAILYLVVALVGTLLYYKYNSK